MVSQTQRVRLEDRIIGGQLSLAQFCIGHEGASYWQKLFEEDFSKR